MIGNEDPLGSGILLVNEDEDFIQSTGQFLKDNGCRVAIAHNGEEALRIIQAGNIKGLVLDLRMPVMNGLEVYLELKKQDRVIPTIVLTVYRSEEIGQFNLFQWIANIGYLFKPFKPDELNQAY